MHKLLLLLLMSAESLLLVHGQLDLPHQPTISTPRRAPRPTTRPADTQTSAPLVSQKQQQQPPQQQQQQQPPYFNNFNPHNFGGPPPNFPFNFPGGPFHPQQQQPQQQQNGTAPQQQPNGYGPYGNNFGPGYFGYGAPHNPVNFLYPQGQSQQQVSATPNDKTNKDDPKTNNPNAETIPGGNPGFNQFNPGFGPQQPFNPNQHGSPFGALPPHFSSFQPNFGHFDYGFGGGHPAPPQLVGSNINVGGLPGPGPGPEVGPVPGFYGPPPNLGQYGGYGGIGSGFNYPGQQHPFASPTNEPEPALAKPPPELVIK